MLRLLPKIIRVSGFSMFPVYKDGDYVVISTWLIQQWLKKDRDIVFHHRELGILIKRIMKVDKLKKTILVYGLNPESTQGDKIGEIPFQNILGLVVFHLKV